MKNVNGQDSNLYGTWYLHQLEADLQGLVWDIEDVQPDFIPSLTINNDLTFEGLGACNGFGGDYSYDASENTLYPNNFSQTLILCDTSEDVNFENLFFAQVSANTNNSVTINMNANFTELKLENYPGYLATYRNVSLSTPEQSLAALKIYPNPVSDQLFISNRNSKDLDIVIYDILGKQVLQKKSIKQSVDVSNLLDGIYFLEINSDNGMRIEKIIKS
ncbi:T9SS type A sorting domain-containing protein [Winogradskyella ludwigii]|uniref:T9SS type A sorting domain-containing protein n=1 Tax=Winogradskyella ludwigii TaxID=2686076 RepID=UPI0015CABB36|nr:T9SS type A sorting domain-containing protein [Winogradskyella ludwigii]